MMTDCEGREIGGDEGGELEFAGNQIICEQINVVIGRRYQVQSLL